MEIPTSTEALTKLLRSKGTTTSQIVEITSHFDELDLYFPNKEVFILELIQDRWNDQKLINFKKDYKIWKLYNDIFSKVTDDTIRKKLLKDLRFVPHLMKALEVVDSDIPEILIELERICVLINSMIRVEVSAENAITILGKTLGLIQRTDSDHETLVLQVINLTDISNFAQVSSKMSDCYCRELLLPTIKYFVKFGSELTLLSNFLSKFLFEPSMDPVQLLESFVGRNYSQLDSEDCILIFEKSMQCLSKQNFSMLEKIFTVITSTQKQLAPSLLKKLSISKKTMSQEFLDQLLSESLRDAKYDHSFWSLLLHILDLDVEIGIQNFDQLIKLVVEWKDKNFESIEKLWGKLIQCFINAREFLGFLEKIQTYCGEQRESSIFLLQDPNFANKISNNVSTLSVAQLKVIITNLMDGILSGSSNTSDIGGLVLKLILKGLSRLSYISLPELKPAVAKVFEVQADHPSKLWEIWYLAMEVYDDIVPLDSLESIEKQLSLFFSLGTKPKELFYYFLKLREYTTFDLGPLSDTLLQFLQESTTETRRVVLRDIFSNWYSLLNSSLPRNSLEQLTNFLVSEDCIDLLNELFEDDNIFEEPNVIYFLVQKLQERSDQQNYVLQLRRIPIQCINKTVRSDLINSLSSKKVITNLDIELIGHLLSNPTFKSRIERQTDSLYFLLSHTTEKLTYENVAVEKVWQNHLGQLKETNSINFIQEGSQFIFRGMNENTDNIVYFQMAFLALKVCRSTVLDPLKKEFVEKCFQMLSNAEIQDIAVVIWFLRALYYVFKLDNNCISKDKSAQRTVSDICRSIKTSDKGIQKELLTSIFLLYSTTYDGKLEYLYAHYMVLRQWGIESKELLPAIEDVLSDTSKTNLVEFNQVFGNLTFSLGSCKSNFNEGLLELYRIQIEHLEKENQIGTHLFVRSLSEFYTNCEDFKSARIPVLQLLTTLQSLLVSKPWLFSQYCIEMMFPLCLKLIATFFEGSDTNDDLFISIVKIISNILLAQGVKLTNRHHLMNSFLCVCLELIADYKNTGLSSQSAKSLSRLISNYVEPSSSGNNYSNKHSNKNTLSSTIGLQKKLLRKYVPVLLIKFIHLSIYRPFESPARKELASGVYAIFDLISQAELNMINSILDHAGRQYFKSLYAEYKKVGKWDAN
ncbi:hypothetical protein ZYGR_0AL01180 [Zygosaccharomyces rouxii]|uniref:Nucleolar 27S pre-rRNA processing Urb2/Npa2 C-terminal domain-containing protein n=1 Tax=Zygosaccharomyces rouxii TaxID=4956 RepID=A0A1Q3AF45_ZYGRO|nr:hypothetical protein ZYGR_0AL01180 [Zygosaccharomyces rouxii]